jgi:hypothetical protein
MRSLHAGLVLLTLLAPGLLAGPAHAVAALPQVAGGSGDKAAGKGQDPCIELGKNDCKTLPPGQCAKTALGEQVTNTGGSSIKVCTDKKGKVSSIDLGESGSATYSGNGGKFTVKGGGACSLTVTGDNNTVTVTMGANSGGGSVDVNGNGNTVTNVNNNHGGTGFNSTPSNPAGTGNTLNLGGEPGNQTGGVWTVNP